MQRQLMMKSEDNPGTALKTMRLPLLLLSVKKKVLMMARIFLNQTVNRFSPFQLSEAFATGQRRRAGQVVIEYLLLLIITLAVALVLINSMVGRGANGDGFVVQKWKDIIRTIGEDNTDAVP